MKDTKKGTIIMIEDILEVRNMVNFCNEKDNIIDLTKILNERKKNKALRAYYKPVKK